MKNQIDHSLRDKRWRRLFGILGQISPHSHVTVHDLAGEYGVDKRTIQRDIEVLESAKIGVHYHQDKVRIHRTGYKKIKSWMVE